MISLTAKRALSRPGMKPHAAPARKPESIISGIVTNAGVPAGTSGRNTTALAPHAPIRNWPSAPMFHSRIRKASAQARPVRISGVALTSVSEMTPDSPKAASNMCWNDLIGSPPTSRMMKPEITKETKTAPMVTASGSQRGTSSRRSTMIGSRSLMRLRRPRAGLLPVIMQADVMDVSGRGVDHPEQFALVDDGDPVGKGQDLVELLADQQDGRAALALLEQQPVDVLDRANIQAARGLHGDHQSWPGLDLARQDQALQVAAG